MAASEITICKSALVKVGEEMIASLDDDSKAARRCKSQYPLKRDELQESYNWTFCMARTTLAPLAEAPPFGFAYQFLLPPDCLRFVGMYDAAEPITSYTSSKVPHKIEGRRLLLEDNVANIFYIKKVTDPNLFSAMFAEALALSLAGDVAYDLTGGENAGSRLDAKFARQIRQARFVQAIQGTPEVIASSEWVDAHGYDSYDPAIRFSR